MPPTVTIEAPGVFIDSGGFIALHVPGDTRHSDAISCRDRTLRFSRLYTSSLVISETVGHIQRDHLLDQANLHDLLNDFLKPEKWISLLLVDDDMMKQALQMVKDRNDRRFSLTDATNILLMERNGVDSIFSFDSLYDGVSLRRGYSNRFVQRISG